MLAAEATLPQAVPEAPPINNDGLTMSENPPEHPARVFMEPQPEILMEPPPAILMEPPPAISMGPSPEILMEPPPEILLEPPPEVLMVESFVASSPFSPRLCRLCGKDGDETLGVFDLVSEAADASTPASLIKKCLPVKVRKREKLNS